MPSRRNDLGSSIPSWKIVNFTRLLRRFCSRSGACFALSSATSYLGQTLTFACSGNFAERPGFIIFLILWHRFGATTQGVCVPISGAAYACIHRRSYLVVRRCFWQ